MPMHKHRFGWLTAAARAMNIRRPLLNDVARATSDSDNDNNGNNTAAVNTLNDNLFPHAFK